MATSETESFDAERNYQNFPGRAYFICYGRCMISQDINWLLGTISMIVLSAIIFFVFDCPLLAKISISLPIIGVILLLTVIVSLFRTNLSDPGILPRSTKDEEEINERFLNDNVVAKGQNKFVNTKVNDINVKMKYCYTCKFFRPPRSSHCAECDNCVDKFDHHCPWIGNCVGRRNYRSFLLFTGSIWLTSIYLCSCSIFNLVSLSLKFGLLSSLKTVPLSFVSIILTFAAFVGTSILNGYHFMLLYNGLTTNEYLKGLYDTSGNPYDKGLIKNFIDSCCSPAKPSVLRLREYVEASTYYNMVTNSNVNSNANFSPCLANHNKTRNSPFRINYWLPPLKKIVNEEEVCLKKDEFDSIV